MTIRTVKYTEVKSEDNAFNSFLADEDKIGDQIKATVTLDSQEVSGMGDTKEEAFEDLTDQISAFFSRQSYVAKLKARRASGQEFFE